MRKSWLLLALALLLTLPVAASAGKGPPERDGTLEIDGGRGKVGLNLRGSLIARIARVKKGKLKLRVVKSEDSEEEAVRVRGRPLRHKQLDNGTDLYWGKRIRVRIEDSMFKLRIEGGAIHLSAVGRGRVALDGSDVAEDVGEYSVNGSEWEPIPREKTSFKLEAPPPEQS